MSLVRKARSFMRAIAGGRDGSLIPERLAICRSCEHVKTIKWFDDETLTEKERIFCGQCGCGTRGIAELHHKLGYRKLKCPVGKWGEDGALEPKQATGVIGAMEAAERQARGEQVPQQQQRQRSQFPPAQPPTAGIPADVAKKAFRPANQPPKETTRVTAAELKTKRDNLPDNMNEETKAKVRAAYDKLIQRVEREEARKANQEEAATAKGE